MKTKLFVTDVDGTLVKDGSGFCNPEYFNVIREIRRRGGIFMAASGRQYTSLNRMFNELSDDMCYISESGVIVWDDGKPNILKEIPYETICEMALDVKKMGNLDLMISGPLKSYVPIAESKMHKWVRDSYGYDIKVCPDWIFPEDEHYVKVAVYSDDNIEEATRGWFYDKWKERLHLCFAGYMWMDCVMPGLSKGDALRDFQISHNISREETVCFGDNQNDLEMMKCAVRSYAVSTARSEVKDIATGVIPNYEEDGVLKKIKEILAEEA